MLYFGKRHVFFSVTTDIHLYVHKSTIDNLIADSYYLFRGVADSELAETAKRKFLFYPTLNYCIIVFVNRIAKVR